MTPREVLAEIGRRNRVLAFVGWLHVGLFVVAVALIPVDGRTILGIDPWIKPMKFMASIAIFVWTLAWFTPYVADWRWTKRIITWGPTTAMIGETVAIWTQSARGTTSHFNIATAFDGAVFGLMGFLILLNTLVVAWFTLVMFLRRSDLPLTYLWGIRLGLIVFLFGSIEGGMIIANNAHTVGLPDGGPGLPIVNWSTEGGDLRVAHALGLHAMQVLPLVGFAINRWRGNDSTRRRLTYLTAVTIVYVALMASALIQAQAGRPLIAI